MGCTLGKRGAWQFWVSLTLSFRWWSLMGLKCLKSKPLVMFPNFPYIRISVCFSVWLISKNALKSVVHVKHHLIILQKGEEACTVGPFGMFCFFMQPFITICLELCICLVMTDNLYNEEHAGHQSGRSGWVLLTNEVGNSQESGQRRRLPWGVSGSTCNELMNMAPMILSGNVEIIMSKC